jgi:hypothetical protein
VTTGQKSYSLGTPESWKIGPYYDPANPNVTLYDKGVVVSFGNGTQCAFGTARKSLLFLQCDPTVTERPKTVQIQEMNPVTNMATPCEYWFAPIVHASFCPKISAIPDNSPIAGVKLSIYGTSDMVDFTSIVTTTPAPFLNTLGFSCHKISTSNCSNSVFECNGSTNTGGNVDASIVAMKFNYQSAEFSYQTYDRFYNVTCPTSSEGFFGSSGGVWNVLTGQTTAEVNAVEIVTIVESAESCYSCNN